VFHNDERVVGPTEIFERIDQAFRITTMETHGWLIENVDDTRESRLHLDREADTLSFAARERISTAGELEITEAYLFHCLETSLHLAKKWLDDTSLPALHETVTKWTESFEEMFHALTNEIINRELFDFDSEGDLLETFASTLRTHPTLHVGFDFGSEMIRLGLSILLLKERDHTRKSIFIVPLLTMEDDVVVLGR
jgi:hypothetical protein